MLQGTAVILSGLAHKLSHLRARIAATIVLCTLGLGDNPASLVDALTSPASAATQSDFVFREFRECGVITHDSIRLACFDAILKGGVFTLEDSDMVREKAFGSEHLPTPTPQPELLSEPKTSAMTETHQKPDPQPERKQTGSAEMSVEVVEARKSPPGWVLHLSNGQVWAQTDKRSLGIVRTPMTGTIKKASLGTYRFSPADSKRSIQVKRRR